MSQPRETRETERQAYLDELRARILRAAGLAEQLVRTLDEAREHRTLGKMRDAVSRADGECALLEAMVAGLKQDVQRIQR